MRTRDFRSGVVLVLLSGVVALLLCLAVLFLQATRSASGACRSALEAALSRIAAASGLEYAAARVAGGEPPRGSRTPVDRGDDWACRDAAGTPVERLANPSFSHGEPWIDAAGVAANGLDDDGDGIVDENGEQGDWLGSFTPGETAGPDLDGDGKLSAWTGRLRGGAGSYGLAFSVRADAADAKIPLNAGWLVDGDKDGLDNNADGQIDEAAEKDRNPDPATNYGNDRKDNDGDGLVDEADEKVPVPDCRDLAFPYHQELAYLLDNVGVIAGVSVRRESRATGDFAGGKPGATVELCWIGHDLLSNRPEGGYRTWSQVEETLLALPLGAAEGGPYTRAEIARIRPYVSLGPYDIPPGVTRQGTACPYLSLAAAPREVLEAAWMHLSAPGRLIPSENDAFPDLEPSPVPPPAVWPPQCTRTGPAGELSRTMRYYFPATRSPANPPASSYGFRLQNYLIHRDEAKRLADHLICLREGKLTDHAAVLRQEAALSWNALYEELSRNADAIFSQDQADLAAFPVAARGWVQSKADLAFQAIAMDPAPWPLTGTEPVSSGFAAWAGWGIDRDWNPANGVQMWPSVPFSSIGRMAYPARYAEPWKYLAFSLTGPPWSIWVAGVWTTVPVLTTGDGGANGKRHTPIEEPFLPYRPEGREPTLAQGFTTAPPVRFDVASRGRGDPEGRSAALCEGQISSSLRLDFASQEDFETLDIGSRYLPLGIEVKEVSPPGDPRPFQECRRDYAPAPGLQAMGADPMEVSVSQPLVSSLPRWNQRAVKAPGDPSRAYSHDYGALVLSPRRLQLAGTALQSAKYAWLRPAAQGEPSSWGFDDFDGTAGGAPGTGEPDFLSLRPSGPGGASLAGNPVYEPSFSGPMDQEGYGPFAVRGTAAFDCPSNPPSDLAGLQMESCALEAWIESSGGMIQVKTARPPNPPFPTYARLWPSGEAIQVAASRGFYRRPEDPAKVYPAGAWSNPRPETPGTWFAVRVAWRATELAPDMSGMYRVGVADSLERRFFIADKPGAGRSNGTHHVVLSLQRVPNPDPFPGPGMVYDWTRVRLFVDGSGKCDGAIQRWTRFDGNNQWQETYEQFQAGSLAMEYYHHLGARQNSPLGPPWRTNPNGRMYTTPWERVTVARADEIRFYDRDLTEPEAANRYAQGRHVFPASPSRPATFTSPLYAFRSPTALGLAQWTGIRVPGQPDDALKTKLVGYLDADGTQEAWAAPAGIDLGEPGAVTSLGANPAIRSFRYQVEFRGAGPLYDSPVFESLWLMVPRRAAWSRFSWSSH